MESFQKYIFQLEIVRCVKMFECFGWAVATDCVVRRNAFQPGVKTQ